MQKTKINFRIVLLIAVLLSTGACNDWLSLQPENALVREEFWNKKEDVEAVLAAMYDSFRGNALNSFLYGEIRADMFNFAYLSGDWSSFKRISQNDITSTNSEVEWDKYYETINLANTILQFAPPVLDKDKTFTREALQGIQAEAIFIKSLCYFYLARVWKDVPYVGQATSSDTVQIYLPKQTEYEVIGNVIKDLKAAEGLAFTTQNYNDPELFRGRGNKFAIQALIADMYLWTEQYQKCIEYCDKVIDSGIYTLQSLETWLWFELYYPGNSNEGIFEIQYNDRYDGQENPLYKNLLKMLRPSAYSSEIFLREDTRTCGRYGFTWKYSGASYDGLARTSNERDANFIYYRYADILLMKAEAMGETGNINAATALINEIIQRAGLVSIKPPVDLEDFRTVLLEERAREFAAEGKRWFDLLRFAKKDQFANKKIIMNVLLEGADILELPSLRARVLDTMGYYLPIMEDDLTYNPNLVQNPFYDK